MKGWEIEMLVFEVEKKDVQYIMGFFEECKKDVGIIETHRFSGSSEIIQIAVMLTTLTAGGVAALVNEIRKSDRNIRIKGEGRELKLEEITEEYLQTHKQNEE